MKKILLFITLLLLAFTQTIFAAESNKENEEDKLQTEKITLTEMNQRLQNIQGDILYLKTGEDEVLVYQDTANNRSLRKQIILAAPESEMLRFYTNNKKTFEQMSKMLRDYETNNTSFGGYKIITDTDLPQKLEQNVQVYRFWFMKLSQEKHETRFPIGIGIGIGGGHHHGPWIGIGW